MRLSNLIDQTDTYEQRVTVTKTFSVYECQHCDETWDIDADLPLDELRYEVTNHYENEHPEAL